MDEEVVVVFTFDNPLTVMAIDAVLVQPSEDVPVTI
jgi:hypothetical protein